MTNDRLVLLAVGDVGPIHEPMESYSALARETLRGADLRFAQVERVYSDLGALQLHSGGEHSRVKPEFASVFDDCGFDIVSVASNHAMDWGPEAMLDSIELFRRKGIATVGAGRNLEEARKPAFIERNGIRIAFLAYCTVLREGYTASSELRDELREHVVQKIGALARPDDILFSADLPKTRSGKIMRRLLRDIAEGRTLGDTTTLADPNVVAKLKEQYEEKE